MTNIEIIETVYSEAAKDLDDKWLLVPNDEWYNYVMNLHPPLRITYLIVVLNSQIINGGFHQYFINGYGQFANETLRALHEIGAFKKFQLLQEAFEKVNVKNLDDVSFRKMLLKNKIDILFNTNDLFNQLNDLDNAYYDDFENIEGLLAKYLRTV